MKKSSVFAKFLKIFLFIIKLFFYFTYLYKFGILKLINIIIFGG